MIGVTVGKFNPPHLGHMHMINTGASQVDHLYIILGDRSDQTIPAETRKRWIETDGPSNITVIITPDNLPDENEPWAERALEILPEKPDLAFTSEPWGDGWAELMGAKHISVDQKRLTVPTSGTKIRGNLLENFDSLTPAAKLDLAYKVVFIGPESSGKSTLAKAVAERYETVWVPEYGRIYWEGRLHLGDAMPEEFDHIVEGHSLLESQLGRKARNGMIMYDTDMMVTSVWHERYIGEPSRTVETKAAANLPNLYVFCEPDFGWIQDGTRESENERIWMGQRMIEKAESYGVEVVKVSGALDGRIKDVVKQIDRRLTTPALV